MRDHVIDVERIDVHLRPGAHFLLAAARFLLLGEDIDVPAGQNGSQAHVLATPTDGQRKLFVRHHDLDAPLILVENHLGDLRRGQRVDDEGRRIGRPRDDIDLLALQFADDRLNAATAHADTSAHGVDRGIVREDRDLGAAARIAGDRFDLDDRVVDLRDFLGKQHGHELRMAARNEYLRAALLLAHIIDVRAHAVASAERFARQGFVAPHHRLGPAQVDGDVAELVALDDAVDDLAGAVLVLPILALTLGLADLLHDDLLGGLRRDAPQIDGRQVFDDKLARLDSRLAPLGVDDRHLRDLVLHLVGHLAVTL